MEEVNRGKYVVAYKKLKGILYRVHQRKDIPGKTGEQIFVPKLLRTRVMEVAHDSMFGGHLGVKNTEDRIQTNFTRKVCMEMLPVLVGLVTCAENRLPGELLLVLR